MREGKCYAEYAEGVCANTGIVDVTKGVCCCQCSNAGWGLAANECEECPAEGTAEFNETCPNGCGYSPIGVGKILEIFTLLRSFTLRAETMRSLSVK